MTDYKIIHKPEPLQACDHLLSRFPKQISSKTNYFIFSERTFYSHQPTNLPGGKQPPNVPYWSVHTVKTVKCVQESQVKPRSSTELHFSCILAQSLKLTGCHSIVQSVHIYNKLIMCIRSPTWAILFKMDIEVSLHTDFYPDKSGLRLRHFLLHLAHGLKGTPSPSVNGAGRWDLPGERPKPLIR